MTETAAACSSSSDDEQWQSLYFQRNDTDRFSLIIDFEQCQQWFGVVGQIVGQMQQKVGQVQPTQKSVSWESVTCDPPRQDIAVNVYLRLWEWDQTRKGCSWLWDRNLKLGPCLCLIYNTTITYITNWTYSFHHHLFAQNTSGNETTRTSRWNKQDSLAPGALMAAWVFCANCL